MLSQPSKRHSGDPCSEFLQPARGIDDQDKEIYKEVYDSVAAQSLPI